MTKTHTMYSFSVDEEKLQIVKNKMKDLIGEDLSKTELMNTVLNFFCEISIFDLKHILKNKWNNIYHFSKPLSHWSNPLPEYIRKESGE